MGDMSHSKFTKKSGRGVAFGGASKSKGLFLSKKIIFGTKGFLAPEVLERAFIMEDEDQRRFYWGQEKRLFLLKFN